MAAITCPDCDGLGIGPNPIHGMPPEQWKCPTCDGMGMVSTVRTPLQIVEALLLFHSGQPWDEAARQRWLFLTGAEVASTRTLCDAARATLAKANGLPAPIC